MPSRPLILIHIFRFIAAGVCIFLAGQMAWTTLVAVVEALREGNHQQTFFVLAIALILAMPISAGLAWLGWRLWNRWNAATVRWVCAVLIAVGLLMIGGLFHRWLDTDDGHGPQGFAMLAGVGMLIIGAIVYRKLTQWILRNAGLNQVLDVYGQPAGHATRVRIFAIIFGWLLFHGLFLAARRLGVLYSRDEAFSGVGIVLGIVCGYASYRLIIWWSRPPTLPATPPEHAFPVFPPSDAQ